MAKQTSNCQSQNLQLIIVPKFKYNWLGSHGPLLFALFTCCLQTTIVAAVHETFYCHGWNKSSTVWRCFGFTKFWKLRLFRQLCKPMLMLNIIILKSQRFKAQRLCHDHFSLKGLFRPMYKTHHNMTICGLSLHHENTESRKSLEQKFIFQLGTLSPHGMNASHSTNLFTDSCDHISTNGKAPLHSHINHNTPQFLYLFWRRANARNVSFPNLWQW